MPKDYSGDTYSRMLGDFFDRRASVGLMQATRLLLVEAFGDSSDQS